MGDNKEIEHSAIFWVVLLIVRAWKFLQTSHQSETLHSLIFLYFLASKCPISVEKQKEFESMNKKTIFGYFIPKGINYAKITKTQGGISKVYHIFDTHFEVSLSFIEIILGIRCFIMWFYVFSKYSCT